MSTPESNYGSEQFCRLIERNPRHYRRPENILVVGCAWGHEVHYIRYRLGGIVIGIEIDGAALFEAGNPEGLVLADAERLPFTAQSFDAVFAHHVLEHVNDPVKAVESIARVIRPCGAFYIGAPNKRRLFSPVDINGQRTITGLFEVNVREYRQRLRGRFENRYGAHAGFTLEELVALVAPYFEDVEVLTIEHLREKHAHRRRWMVQTVADERWAYRIAPAHYLICRKMNSH
jgi:SAM-dependent methyltransferase